MTFNGYLGIDAGTQGLSVLFTDEALNVIATGDGDYKMINGLADGCYEQLPDDWEAALATAMSDLRAKLSQAGQGEPNVLAIGIAGQMHGQVLVDGNRKPIGSARLWCDNRNESEGAELTQLLGVKIPKRMTAARWLWTIRNDHSKASQTKKIATPTGWLSYLLTGSWCLGIGDASGMFPIDQSTLSYDQAGLQKFQQLAPRDVPELAKLLPELRKAGEDGGVLNSSGAAMLGLPEGIPVAPAEGDQPAALAGSKIAEAGMVSVSFGTSVCANAIGDRSFQGASKTVDHFCAVDGKPINMVFLRNGTTFMNTVVGMFTEDRDHEFSSMMQAALEADADCGGVLALPFMDDEPGLGIGQGGGASLVGLNETNATPGNMIRAALVATMMNLRIGLEDLSSQGFPRTEIILTGGLAKTPELGQILANVLQTPVSLPAVADEGTAVGAALLAKYRYEGTSGSKQSWSTFLAGHDRGDARRFEPNKSKRKFYDRIFERYRKLVVQAAHYRSTDASRSS